MFKELFTKVTFTIAFTKMYNIFRSLKNRSEDLRKKKKKWFANSRSSIRIIAICFSFIPLVSYVSFVLGALANRIFYCCIN